MSARVGFPYPSTLRCRLVNSCLEVTEVIALLASIRPNFPILTKPEA